MSWDLTILDNWKCAGGVELASVGVVREGALLTEQLDGRHAVTIPVSRDYLDVCNRRNAVAFIRLEDDQWREFRVRSLSMASDDDTSFMLNGVPPWHDLTTADFVRETIAGREVTAFDELLTMTELIQQRILSNKVIDGLGWLDIGDVEFDERLRFQYSRIRRSELLNQGLAQLKRGEIQLRQDGFDRYLIDVVRAIGAGSAVIPVRFGHQLVQASRNIDFEPLYTSVRVIGETPAGAIEPASFGDNVYRVHSVTAIGPGGVGPYAVVLRDPATDESPIQVDGIFARDPNGFVDACWLQLASGNTTEILDTRAATGDVVVAIPPSVNDRVVIVQTLDNHPLRRITYPAAVAEHGVAVANAQVTGGRGERNFIVNPGFDGSASEYAVAGGSIMTVIPRNAVVPKIGAMAGTKTPGAPASFAVDGFVPGDTVPRGSVCEVAGAELITSGDVFLDANGDATLPLVGTLPATIPANTQIRSNAVAYLLSRGSSNTIGDADIDISVPGAGTTPWATDDELTLTIQVAESQTVAGATNRTLQFVTIDLAVAFTRDIPTGALIRWTSTPATQMLQVADAYIAGALSIIVRHPTWTPQAQLRGEVQPFGTAGQILTHTAPVTSRHTVTNSPTWNVSGQATVIISPALPIAAPVADTTIRWDRVGASAYVGALQLIADQVATATTFVVYGPGHVVVIPDGSVLTLVGETFVLTANTTFDGGGAGTLSVVFAPTVTLLDNAAVRIAHNTEWADEQGGGAGVAMMEGTLAVDETAPGLSDVSPRSQPFRVVLPPGISAQVFARVAITFFSPLRTNAAQQYGTAKIALVNLDTNAVVAWAGSQPEDADELSAPANARLPLEWDAGSQTWLPMHLTMSCNVLITQTTRLELRYYGPIGVSSATYGRTYVRWSTVWVAGAVDGIPYVNGSRGNDLLVAGVQLLARDAQPADAFALEMDVLDRAYAAAADLPDVAFPTLRIGSRLLIEPENAELRVLAVDRQPDRRLSRVTVGKANPSANLTLAALAVVTSLGGAR
jgi:hypothetical protein